MSAGCAFLLTAQGSSGDVRNRYHDVLGGDVFLWFRHQTWSGPCARRVGKKKKKIPTANFAIPGVDRSHEAVDTPSRAPQTPHSRATVMGRRGSADGALPVAACFLFFFRAGRGKRPCECPMPGWCTASGRSYPPALRVPRLLHPMELRRVALLAFALQCARSRAAQRQCGRSGTVLRGNNGDQVGRSRGVRGEGVVMRAICTGHGGRVPRAACGRLCKARHSRGGADTVEVSVSQGVVVWQPAPA